MSERLNERTVRMVFDPVLKRPGCVLIQSAYGCGDANGILSRVDSRLWLLAPTPDMRIFEMPMSEALKFPEQCNGYHALLKRGVSDPRNIDAEPREVAA